MKSVFRKRISYAVFITMLLAIISLSTLGAWAAPAWLEVNI